MRAFDRTGTGSADSAFVTLCINTAESEATMLCGAAFPGNFNDGGAAVDEAVKHHLCVMAHWAAVSPQLSASPGSPLGESYKLARKFFENLARDNFNRLRTSAGGRARPRARVANAQDSSGEYTNPFSRAADKKDKTAF